jgi:hypothetical protein
MKWKRSEFMWLLLVLALGCGGAGANPDDAGATDERSGPDAARKDARAATTDETGCHTIKGSGSTKTCSYESNCSSLDASLPDSSLTDSDSLDASSDPEASSPDDASLADASFREEASIPEDASPSDAPPPDSIAGSCPSSDLFGCCVFTTDAGLPKTAVCYYSKDTSVEDTCEFNGYESFGEYWQTAAP